VFRSFFSCQTNTSLSLGCWCIHNSRFSLNCCPVIFPFDCRSPSNLTNALSSSCSLVGSFVVFPSAERLVLEGSLPDRLLALLGIELSTVISQHTSIVVLN